MSLFFVNPKHNINIIDSRCIFMMIIRDTDICNGDITNVAFTNTVLFLSFFFCLNVNEHQYLKEGAQNSAPFMSRAASR